MTTMESTSVPAAPAGNEYYEVRKIPGKGYGCFALKPLLRGTRILAEDPLLIVPKANYMLCDIEKAFAELTPDQKKLYFSLHSGHGQDPKQWPSRIHESVEAKERQRIQEQHAARVGKEPTVISIFQINCMEMNRGAAVFPYSARFNHACNPKACFTWNSNIGKETIHIMNDVAMDDEITISYCDMIHDKALRQWELKHYGFVCDCPACGNEDDESSFAYQSAERRYKLQELERETRFLRGANLTEGAKQDDFVQKLVEIAALHTLEGDFSARLAAAFLDIALVCEHKGDMKMAEAAGARAVQVKKDCQGTDIPNYGSYADSLHRIKMKLALAEAQRRA
ncbi:SET domain-containing 5 [Pyrenophora seminiperda CCB06]|uniref:SET domain-containing 5 n=1 Tax=Pyrenophora seminiperda CCB06 TaxID=1302712 RepID=A0A3M7M790_9PLEO|nr:SET domain-containing 5 [Pyrenophora seminiperda CCB06]